MNDVSENLGDASHFFFFPALVNIYNLDEFDLEEMLHYLAYSGSAVGLVDLLDGSTKDIKELVFGFIAAHELIMREWIYFATKFNKPCSLRLLKQIQAQFKCSAKPDLKKAVIKAKICGGKLVLVTKRANNGKRSA